MAGAPAKPMSSGFCWKAAVDFMAVQPHHHLFSPSRRSRCWWWFYYSCCCYLLASSSMDQDALRWRNTKTSSKRIPKTFVISASAGQVLQGRDTPAKCWQKPICRPLVKYLSLGSFTWKSKVNSIVGGWRWGRGVGVSGVSLCVLLRGSSGVLRFVQGWAPDRHCCSPGLLLLTRVGCSGQTLNLLTRIFGAIFTSSCFVLGPGDTLYVLPDPGSTDSPASSSHSHNIHVVLVASCTCDLEITTVHPLCGYSLSSRFPPGKDGTWAVAALQ